MQSHLHRAICTFIGIGLVSGALVWGASSLTSSSYAPTIPSPTAMAVATAAPAYGFSKVAKQVTPAVVNHNGHDGADFGRLRGS